MEENLQVSNLMGKPLKEQQSFAASYKRKILYQYQYGRFSYHERSVFDKT